MWHPALDFEKYIFLCFTPFVKVMGRNHTSSMQHTVPKGLLVQYSLYPCIDKQSLSLEPRKSPLHLPCSHFPTLLCKYNCRFRRMDVLPMLYDAADIPLPRTRRQNLHLYEKSLFPNSRSPPLYPII